MTAAAADASPIPVIELEDVHVTYQRGDVCVEALRGVSLSIKAGEFAAIVGPSGSGKSTLLRAMAGLCPVTSGRVSLSGRSITKESQAGLAVLRRQDIGVVHQLFNLLPDLSAADNIGLPLELDGWKRTDVQREVHQTMERLEIGDLGDRMPEDLSGGEQLRVALARALVIEPEILLADEPTGSLDQANSRNVMEIFRSLNSSGTTILVVTHNPEVSAAATRVLRVVDGQIAS